MFSQSYSDVIPVLEATATSNTHLAVNLWVSDPLIAQRTSLSDTYNMGTSVAQVTSLAQTQHTNAAATVTYDIEKWAYTPANEQADPVGAIARAAAAVHAAGRKFGVNPGGPFLGDKGCGFNIQNGIVPSVDWTQVDQVTLQVQNLMSERWCSGYGSSNFTAAVTAYVNAIRAKNPNVYIAAELSMDRTSPLNIILAANSVRGIVDGIYVSYPAPPCEYCTPANLQTVLQAI
jgi:hypothetical protein